MIADIRATKLVVLQVCLDGVLGENSSGYYVKCPSMSTATLRQVAMHPCIHIVDLMEHIQQLYL